MQLRALSWNLFHGRDAPPDPALFTWRSRLLRITEHNATHKQVNRDLLDEFAGLLDKASWEVALLQECPPRWAEPLATACGAEGHPVLTARNSFGALRAALARLNPDLIASNEGGSNLTLARGGFDIAERRELVLYPGPEPERRVLAFTRLRRGAGELCVANTHLTARPSRRDLARSELLDGVAAAVEWAGDAPLLLGGDFNLRPAETDLYDELAERYQLRGPTAPDSLDHLLIRGLAPLEPPHEWPAEAREVLEDGLAIRLSDHAPVEAAFASE